MSQPTMVEFDLDRYLRNSKKVDLTGIDCFARAMRAADPSLPTDAYEVVRPIDVESHERSGFGRP